MKRIVSAVAVVMLVVAFAPAASATDSRSQSLLYNLAFEDQTDVFLFPQLLPVYEGAYFHLPSNNPGGVFGGMILGLGDAAFGVFIRRPLGSAFDQFRLPVTDVGSPAGMGVIGGDPGAAVEPHVSGQIFDLMYGTRSWGVNLRLFLFSDISVQFPPLADPLPATAAFITELNAGLNVSPGFDMRVGASIRHDEDVSDLILIRAGMRYLEPGEKKMRLVIAGELQAGFLLPSDDSIDSSFGFTIPLKGGVRFTAIPGKLYFALLGGLDLQILKIQDADMRFGLSFPSVELAGEWYALDWLRVRSAIKGAWGIQLAGLKDADDDPIHPKYEQMVFSSGVGIPLGPFCLDAVIQYALWNNGPYFIGGVPGLFAGVSLSFQWGSGIAGSAASGDDGWSTPQGSPKPVIKPKPAPPPPETKPAPVEEKPAEEKPAEEKPTEEKPAEEKSSKEKPAKDKKEGSFEGWEE
jgi:hypothetical protein